MESWKAMKKVIIAFVVVVVVAAVIGVSFYMRNIRTPDNVVRAAVREGEFSGKYIICSRADTTGFDWFVEKDEYGDKTDVFCNIYGPTPFSELRFKPEFNEDVINSFVFYIDAKTVYYSEELNEDVTEYTVSGWDILYPVKHGGVFGMFGPREYITEDDLQ